MFKEKKKRWVVGVQKVTKKISIHMSNSHLTDKYSYRQAENIHSTHAFTQGVNALIVVCCYPDVSVSVTA